MPGPPLSVSSWCRAAGHQCGAGLPGTRRRLHPAVQDEAGAAFLEDLRRIDAQLRDTNKRLTTAVRASGTTITEVFGVGPVIAATMIGYASDPSRFPPRARFAASHCTPPPQDSPPTRTN